MIFPRITKQKEQGNLATYEIEPLEPGYGRTIAHALQRVLYSLLPGAAVVAMKIAGIPRNGQNIFGVEESVSEMVLNIKQIRVRCDSPHPITMILSASGIGKVTAADIITPSTVEILNPDLPIATLSQEQANLTITLIVQQGRGYLPAEAQAEPPPGFIPIDAIYTPVRKAAYTIEPTRVGKMVNFEKVLFEIETDGTLPPDEALRQSASILMEQFLVFTTLPLSVQADEKSSDASDVAIPMEVYNLPLSALNLPKRSHNSFKRNGITKAGQILTMSEVELRSIRNIGEKSIPAIVGGLRKAGCFPAPLEAIPSSK